MIAIARICHKNAERLIMFGYIYRASTNGMAVEVAVREFIRDYQCDVDEKALYNDYYRMLNQFKSGQ